MIPYNTDMEPVKLHEYGRHIQDLVEYCTGITDRDERNACAFAMVDTIAGIFPELVGSNHDYSKIWDLVNIISGFKLDVDFPCEVITSEKLNPTPRKIPYTSSVMRFRHYGKNIEHMIEKVAALEENEEKELLVSLIAHHMKKLMLQHNKEGVEDAKILRDLALYSNGKINLDPATYLLHEYKEIMPEKHQSKKKKKRK
ncbi:MAG: DUF4290 domain-containing protein [Candidatus Amulumruptor caecigallinarius]|nr:DUF4290 domain-containing protein [Candidatus Amulumruptor caecigallinarius]